MQAPKPAAQASSDLVALVTGANKGIGREIARQLIQRGVTVYVGARELARGQAAAAELGPLARAILLDVTDPASIRAAAAQLERDVGRLDILINNAAIPTGPSSTPGRFGMEEILRRGLPSAATMSDIRAVFETNVFGAIAVIQAMLPLLRRAPAARIVNVSSGAGSSTRLSDPANPFRAAGGVAYGPSKAALNAVTVAFSIELAGTPIKINSACPGFTATDFNDHSGTRTVAQAATEPVRLALLPPDGPTGTFSNDAGPLPW